jgi:hypothetical protein
MRWDTQNARLGTQAPTRLDVAYARARSERPRSETCFRRGAGLSHESCRGPCSPIAGPTPRRAESPATYAESVRPLRHQDLDRAARKLGPRRSECRQSDHPLGACWKVESDRPGRSWFRRALRGGRLHRRAVVERPESRTRSTRLPGRGDERLDRPSRPQRQPPDATSASKARRRSR